MIDPVHDPARAARRATLLALLGRGDVDAALQAGLMDYTALPGDDADAPLLVAQQRLRTAWEARERHRARAARLARIAAEREARRRAAATPATAPGAPAPGPALPPAAAAALERARARAAAARKP